MCCLPTCAQGSCVSVTEFEVEWCILEGSRFSQVWLHVGCWPFMLTKPRLRKCACHSRPLGGSRWGHYLRSLLGVHWVPLECACKFWDGSDGVDCHSLHNSIYQSVLREILALESLPSLHGCNACLVNWNRGASGGNFWHASPCWFTLREFFRLVGALLKGFECMAPLDWHDPASRAGFGKIAVEVFTVGGWLTYGDFALEADVDSLDIVEHRLILSQVRGEWAMQKAKGLASVWEPASQESSHVVGDAGVGVVSMKGGSCFFAHSCHGSV